MEAKNALPAAATTKQSKIEIPIQNTTYRCGLTMPRIAGLMDLIDLVNRQCNVMASLHLSKYDAEILVTLLFNGRGHMAFSTDTFRESRGNFTSGDRNLESAEAYLRVLLHDADRYEELRGRDYECA